MRQLLCTLEDSEFATRGAEWRTLLGAASQRGATPEGVRLVFPNDAAVAEQVEDLMAKEAACCAWMVFDIERTGDTITVTASGPEEARAGLVSAFANASI